jgi:cell division protease FtsH
MITRYGMSDAFGLIGMETVENQYLDGRSVLNCSDQTAAKIDEEVMKILKNAYDIALNLLRNNMEALDEIAHFLIEKETITGKEFMEIFNRINNEKNAPAETAESTEEDTATAESTEFTDENTQEV